jgi:hypothetical protein
MSADWSLAPQSNSDSLPKIHASNLGLVHASKVLTPEPVVTHEHDLVQKLLVAGAPTGQTGMQPPPSEPEIFFPGGTSSGKKHLGLI